ncbi:GAF domain-containing protein [Candidatus Woesearchaeota archaeon]|jgi:class 3 adenylate cyclase/putative methionine-R-sulfoxide reductase with GAF domain|nr:GAF domain-containing protein [Candidatus Woesearchaeota archaeon]
MAGADKIKKLVAKIHSQGNRLQVLNALFELETATSDKYQLLKEILLLSVKSLTVEHGFIVLHNKDSSAPFEYGATNTSEQFEDKTLVRDVCENIIKTRKPVIINDTRLHKRLRRCRIKNIIALPLMFGKDPVGVFMIMNKRKHLFKKRDLILFNMICRFTASAIEHSKGHDELEEKSKELETINKIDRIRDTIKDFKTLIDAILQELIQVIDAKLAFFFLYDKKTNKTELKVSGKLKSSTFVHNNSDTIYDMSRSTLNQGELTEFKNLTKDIKSAICTPIVVSDDTLGVFGVINSNTNGGFSRVDKNLLNAIAKQSDSAVFEDMEKTELKKAFQRYVSPDVIEEIMSDTEKDFLRTDKRELTVLFSDLRGFTELSEKLDPEEVVEILNEHFETMSKIILKQRGTLDKFVGDEIMAVFGAPVYTETHALKAIKTALDMQKAQKELSKKFKKKFGIEVEMGVGINTGDMVVGNIGSRQRMDYTVIGDSVNIASRLCSAAEANQILITESTYAEIKRSVKVKELEKITVKGKSRPLQVYNVTGLAK